MVALYGVREQPPKAASYPGWSPYAGMSNNPLSTLDPNGEEPITIGAIAIAAAIGGGVGAAAYTGSLLYMPTAV